MKKIIALVITASIALSMVACKKVEYTKEFEYVPEYKGMKLEEKEDATEDKMGTAKYTIENAKAEDVLNEYEKNFKKDGWEVTQDDKPISLTFEKEDHKAIIVSTQKEDNVELTIVSK
ncbi:hypothetical protein [Clostridium sp.]|uniref:hypothetical protein n=1 Tax=Clostridium sp. TaxID=1506 RepID=UPI003463F7FD